MQHVVANDTVWRFEIADGPNAGATATLAPGRYMLGSDASNDIVLADPAVSPSHAVLEIRPEHADITPLASGVLLQRRRLHAGRTISLKRGATVTLGATRLRVAGPPAAAPRHRTAPAMICLLLLGLAGAGAAYHGAMPHAAGALPADRPQDGSGRGSGNAMTLAHAVAALRAHLAGTSLLPGLRITASDGFVLATGSVLPQDRGNWLEAQKWFDTHIGSRYALADQVNVATPAELPKLDVAAVSMAPVPNVVTRDGQHYTVGAVLRDGWSIARITPDNIILRSGGREIRITL
jgi:type III secretion protein D